MPSALNPTPADRRLLDRAASYLHTAACAPEITNTVPWLDCHDAVHLLRALGADPRAYSDAGSPATCVRAAMTAMSQLSPPIRDSDPIGEVDDLAIGALAGGLS